jgi:predicted Fe-S protein YdhL (DUF1289 family)
MSQRRRFVTLVHRIRAYREMPEALAVLEQVARTCSGCYGHDDSDMHWVGCTSAEAREILSRIFGRPAPIVLRRDGEVEGILP